MEIIFNISASPLQLSSSACEVDGNVTEPGMEADVTMDIASIQAAKNELGLEGLLH